VTNWARVERQALAAHFVELGPDVPTLCTGWDARRLAAHLVVRERRPDAAAASLAGAAAQPLKDYAASVLRGESQRPWTELVELVRTGPPVWSPLRFEPVDERINTVEFFVHHEDLRRAQVGWQPRVLPAEQSHHLWRHVVGAARLFLRGLPVGLLLQGPGESAVRVRDGDPAVTVVGEPGELALYITGRRDHANVELHGDDDAIARLAATTIRA
jgi:uncharacterized protein (TIGR03085 family)